MIKEFKVADTNEIIDEYKKERIKQTATVEGEPTSQPILEIKTSSAFVKQESSSEKALRVVRDDELLRLSRLVTITKETAVTDFLELCTLLNKLSDFEDRLTEFFFTRTDSGLLIEDRTLFANGEDELDPATISYTDETGWYRFLFNPRVGVKLIMKDQVIMSISTYSVSGTLEKRYTLLGKLLENVLKLYGIESSGKCIYK